MNNSQQHFFDFIGIGANEAPKYLLLVGSSDVSGNLRELTKELRVKNVKATGFPSVFLAKINGQAIAYGTSYAGSFTADIIHAFCEVGVKKVFFIGNCGIINSKKILRGDRLVPRTVIDGIGIAKAYRKKRIVKVETQKDKAGDVTAKAVTCITWHNLFSEDACLVKKWQLEGIDVVDLESAAVVAVCTSFGIDFRIDLVAVDDIEKMSGSMLFIKSMV
jgi:uridine phosphorylase